MATISPATAGNIPSPETVPTRLSAALFGVSMVIHQVNRGVTDLFSGLRRCHQVSGEAFSVVAAESRTRLWSDTRAAEAAYQSGKVQNLTRAVEELNGALLRRGQVFSFWRQIGRASRERGFVTGRMLQQGCMVPAVGGGLCQLSNALHDLALQTGCEIIERHAHSRVVPGSVAEAGRDATVAWNYVDLRFRAPHALLIAADVSHDELTVSFNVEPGTPLALAGRRRSDATVIQIAASLRPLGTANTCGTCEETRCFRKEHSDTIAR